MQVAASVADYIRQFHLAAVFVTKAGAVGCTTDPARLADATRAWWCRSPLDAARLRDEARLIGNVPRVAEELGIALTAHEHVIARAKERSAIIERALEQLQQRGLVAFFNREYKRRRELAQAAGRKFMNYSQARSKLRAVIATTLARNGAMKSRSLIEQVFEPDAEPQRSSLVA